MSEGKPIMSFIAGTLTTQTYDWVVNCGKNQALVQEFYVLQQDTYKDVKRIEKIILTPEKAISVY